MTERDRTTFPSQAPDDERTQLEFIIDGARLGTWVWDIATNETRFNDTWARMLGYELDELGDTSYDTWEGLVHPEDVDSARQALTDCVEGRIPDYTCEFRMRHKEGHWVWILDRGRVMTRDAHGNPLSMFGTHTDIDRLKRSEQELRDNEQFLKTILQATVDGFWVVDDHQRILEVNDAYCAMAGYSREEMLRMSVADIEAEETASDTAKHQQLVQDAGYDLFETRHRRKDGSTFPVEVSVTVINSEKGPRFVSFCRDITRRKEQEQRIALLGKMLDDAPASVTIHNFDGQFLYANRETYESHGYSDEESFLSVHLGELDQPESEALIAERMRKVREHGDATFEVEHRRADGSRLPLEVQAKLIEWEGRPAVLSIATDIFERKQAEAAIRRSEEQVRRKLQAVLDPDEDISQLELAELVDTQTIQNLMADLYRLTNMGIGIIDRKGDILVSVGWQDICTEFHRRHPDTLQHCIESDLQLSGSVEPGAFRSYKCKNNLWDIATPLIIGGQRLGNIFLGQFFFEDEEPDYETFRAQARKYGFDEEAYIDALDRAPRWSREKVEYAMRFYSAFASFVSQLSYGNLKLARTLEERKRIEEEREKLRDQLMQAQKMESVGRLAGGVAHDFNNMLSIILGHSEMMLGMLPDDSPLRTDLEEIHKAADRSANLTRQLLAFARRQTVTPRVLDVDESVTAMLKMLERLIGEDIELIWRPAGTLPPIRIDPAQIDQVLANLVVNARDAIGHGVGRVVIETGLTSVDHEGSESHDGARPGQYVVLSVSDTGCGMDESMRTQVFEPFFTTKGVGQGTGLGLSTVYGIVKQNGGFIEVYSAPGKGSRFTLYLPAHESGRIRTARKEQAAPAPAEPSPSTILVVEDEPAILAMSTKMLEKLGYQVVSAGTPGEAIRKAEEHAGDIDLLMTDVVMPEMDGRELARRVLRLYPDIRRLFMSGYTADVIAHRGVLDEGVQFIQKPFTMSDLAAKLQEVLSTDG